MPSLPNQANKISGAGAELRCNRRLGPTRSGLFERFARIRIFFSAPTRVLVFCLRLDRSV